MMQILGAEPDFLAATNAGYLILLLQEQLGMPSVAQAVLLVGPRRTSTADVGIDIVSSASHRERTGRTGPSSVTCKEGLLRVEPCCIGPLAVSYGPGALYRSVPWFEPGLPPSGRRCYTSLVKPHGTKLWHHRAEKAGDCWLGGGISPRICAFTGTSRAS